MKRPSQTTPIPVSTPSLMVPEGVRGVPPLYSLARPAGSLQIPPSFDAAEEVDAQARAAYDIGDYQRAATHFLSVALSLRLPLDQPYAGPFAANRVLSYRNALSAFIMADAPSEARRALSEAAAGDPLCAGEIEAMLADLPSRSIDP